MSNHKPRVLISTGESDIFRSAEALTQHHFDSRGGVEVIQANHSDNCVRQAASGEFGIIILFGQTLLSRRGPVGSQLDNAIATIQAIKSKSTSSLLALSTMPGEREELLSAGADDFVEMPYRLGEFTSALDRCMSVSQPLSARPRRIVLVDDEPVFVDMVTLMIRARYEVELTAFTSSVAAHEHLQRTDPDMLIVGGIMPELSGSEIVCGLLERKVRYPILVVSGYLSGDAVRGRFPAAPSISFLEKPFSLAALYAELDRHVDPAPVGNLADTNK